MVRNFACLMFIMVILLLSACGGGTSGPGNTVAINAAAADGKPMTAFAHISSNGSWVISAISVNIKSIPYATSSGVDKSDVLINKITFKFTPLSGAFDFNPPFAPSLSIAARIEPGGNTDIDGIQLVYPTDLNKIRVGATGPVQLYQVDMMFSGVEVNTGAAVSTPFYTTQEVDL